MARWLAFRASGHVLGTVEGKTLDEARLQAWARWGPSVDRVESQVSEELFQEGLNRIKRNRRKAEEADDGA